MTEFEETKSPGAEKRRSTRIIKSVPITVTGTDALGQQFRETTTTVMINCYGCKYQTVHYAPKTTVITVEVHRKHLRLPPRTVRGRVIWVQRPRNYLDVYHIGLEFEVPGNIWGLAAPPADWFPFPGDEVEALEPEAVKFPVPPSALAGDSAPDKHSGEAVAIAVAEEFEVDCTLEMAAAAKKPSPPHHANGSRTRELQNGSMREMVREIVEEKLAQHAAAIRGHVDQSLKHLLDQMSEWTIATSDETRQELKALRESLAAQPEKPAKSSSKRRKKGSSAETD